jgi:hypothetical protein
MRRTGDRVRPVQPAEARLPRRGYRRAPTSEGADNRNDLPHSTAEARRANQALVDRPRTIRYPRELAEDGPLRAREETRLI